MTNRSTKNALISSVLALVLCFTSLIGTTFAWFTDSVTSDNNVIQTGTLKIAMSWAEGKEEPGAASYASTGAIFNSTVWEPGYVEAKHIKVENKGTLALKFKLLIEPTGDVSKLADVIDVYYLPTATQVTRETIAAATPAATLAELLADPDGAAYGFLEADDATTEAVEGVTTVTIALKLRENVGNDYQGLSIGSGFSIKLLATQYTYEEDSFNNQYDKDATYVSAGTAEELQAAIASGEPVILTDDITMPAPAGSYGTYTVAAGTKAVINLGGNDLTVTDTDGATPTFLKVEGDLTITGEGNVAVRQINASEGSKLTLGEGVTIETSNSFAINNSGTTEINGATINHTGTNHAIQNNGTGTLTINDATITSSNSTKDIDTINSTGGTVIINGGTFTHEGSYGSVISWLYSNKGEIIINGGTFIQKGGDSLASIDYGDAKLTINGGTFVSESYFAQPMQNIVINAGEFKKNAVVLYNPFSAWTIAHETRGFVPATSTATTNADGSITVTVNE